MCEAESREGRGGGRTREVKGKKKTEVQNLGQGLEKQILQEREGKGFASWYKAEE